MHDGFSTAITFRGLNLQRSLTLLGGSWVAISRVLSRTSILITVRRVHTNSTSNYPCTSKYVVKLEAANPASSQASYLRMPRGSSSNRTGRPTKIWGHLSNQQNGSFKELQGMKVGFQGVELARPGARHSGTQNLAGWCKVQVKLWFLLGVSGLGRAVSLCRDLWPQQGYRGGASAGMRRVS